MSDYKVIADIGGGITRELTAGYATAAAKSESNAATSEANAATSETNAKTSEKNAATSESNAAGSAAIAQEVAQQGTAYPLDTVQTTIQESTGYGVIYGLAVTAQATADMTVAISAGIIHPSSGERYEIAEVSAQAIDTADSALPRTDLIYVSSAGVVTYLAGDLGTAAVAGSCAYTLTTNFASGDTTVFDGITFTVTTATQDSTDFVLGSDIATSMTNFATALNANSTVSATYTASASDGVITITENTAGGGNTPSAMTVTGTGVITEGTATTSTAASSTAPDLPDGALSLAMIAVDAGVTTITDDDLTDLRWFKGSLMNHPGGTYKGAMVAFVGDDGQKTAWTVFYEKIFGPKAENVPCTIPIITKQIGVSSYFLTWDQAVALKKAGWTIASHSHSHIDATAVTETEFEADVVLSKKLLAAHGCDDDFYFAPNGKYNEMSDRVTRKHFRGAFVSGGGFVDGADDTTGLGRTGIFDNYHIERRGGIGEDDVTLAKCKADVDYAVDNDLLLVFCTHPQNVDTDDEIADYRTLIQYIKSLDVPIVNMRDAIMCKGNIVDTGNRNVTGETWERVDCNGNRFGNTDNVVLPNSSTSSTSYVQFATAKIKASECGFKVDYILTNTTGSAASAGNISVEIQAASPITSDLAYVRIANNVEENNVNGLISVFGVVTEEATKYKIVDFYICYNKTYSNVILNNFKSWRYNVAYSEISFVNDADLITALPDGTQYTQVVFGGIKPVIATAAPTTAPKFIGQSLINTNGYTYLANGTSAKTDWQVLGTVVTGGTFTPKIIGSTTAGSHTYTVQEGTYTKIGNVIFGHVAITATIDSTIDGNVRISGLPSTFSFNTSITIGRQSGWGSSGVLRSAFAVSGTNYIQLATINSSYNTALVQGSAIQGATVLVWLQFTYLV